MQAEEGNWIKSKMIAQLVRVYNEKKEFLKIAHYSAICVGKLFVYTRSLGGSFLLSMDAICWDINFNVVLGTKFKLSGGNWSSINGGPVMGEMYGTVCNVSIIR